MSRSAGKSMVRGGALSLARLLSGLVRIKVVALALGVSGVGIFSLLQQVNLTGIAIVSMSLAIPIINLGRPRLVEEDVCGAGRVAGTALAMVAVNALLMTALLVLFGDELLQRLGAGKVDPTLVWPLAVAILFGALAGSFWEGVSFLADRFDIYVRAGIAAAVAETVCVAGAAWMYGLPGAIVALPAGPVVLFGAYALLLRRDPASRQVLNALSVDLGELPRLLAYSAMMFAAVALTQLGLTGLRAQVLLNAGAVANGYLQTVTSLAAYILAFVTTGFWGHLHARAAAAGDTAEVRDELHKALRLGLLIAFTGCGAAAVLADVLIRLFFSGEFRGGAALMVAYMPGELCFQLLSLLIAYQLTISRRRRYLAWSLGYVGLLVTIGLVVIPRFGATGYVAAHNAAAALTMTVAATIAWRTGQLRLPLLLSAAGAVALLAAMCGALLYFDIGSNVFLRLSFLLPVALSGTALLRELRHRKSIQN